MARGGKAKGRGGGAGRGQGPREQPNRVCKPSVPKLPTHLQIHPESEGVPAAVTESLHEFRNIQPFFSALERLAPEVATQSRVSSCWLGYKDIRRLDRPDSEEGFKADIHFGEDQHAPVFIKRVHVLDPMDCIEGECVWPNDGSLPAPSELWMNALEKLNDPMNEAYVDAVFATLADRLVTSNTSPHWLRCFGTCTGRVERYAYNITEEYPSLRRKSFWTRHQKMGLFELRKEVAKDEGSRRYREPLAVEFSESTDLGEGDFEITELPAFPAVPTVPSIPSLTFLSSPATPATPATEDVVVDAVDLDAEEMDSVQLNAPRVRIQRLENSSSSSSTSSLSTEDTDNCMDYFAEFRDFPVQITLLERAEGTLDELLDAKLPEEQWVAWMFQIIAALSSAQYWFGFVHNDLHTNNVMWSRTDRTHLYYRIQNKAKTKQVLYRVPTYGYIMKIIDFGRATFHLPEPAGFFISDAFFPGNDAGQQYNCEPFFDPREGKKVEPNPSFDLCRLAVSMLEAVYPTRPANATPIKIMSREGTKTYAETVSPLYNMMWEWLTDDEGKNVLHEPNGQERYPDFGLYSAIAADVHRAVPWQQLEKPIFSAAFSYAESIPEGETVYELWTGN